jgi:hypothetical protein
MPDRSIILTQEHQYENLSTVNTKPVANTNTKRAPRGLLTPKDQYITQQARGVYIILVSQPEASFDLSFAA